MVATKGLIQFCRLFSESYSDSMARVRSFEAQVCLEAELNIADLTCGLSDQSKAIFANLAPVSGEENSPSDKDNCRITLGSE